MDIYEVSKQQIDGEWTEEQTALTVNVSYDVVTSANANPDDIGTLLQSGGTGLDGNQLPFPWSTAAGMRLAKSNAKYIEPLQNYVPPTHSGPGIVAYKWNVSATYTTAPRNVSGASSNAATSTLAPNLRDPQIDWGGADDTEHVLVDINGNPIVNSRNEPIEGIEREAGNACVTITRNEMTNNAAQWATYSHAINTDTWYGQSPRTVKIGRITARKRWENQPTGAGGTQWVYWEVSYPLIFKASTWKVYVYDYSEIRYDSTTHKPQRALDANGMPVKVKLDGSGGELSDQSATPVIYPTAGIPIRNEQAFSTLALPNPFA